MELIQTQPGFAAYNEPLNLRKAFVREHLGISEWAGLHDEGFTDRLGPYIESMRSGRLRDPRFNRPSPIGPFYRPRTHRIVWKIIHGAEEHINWLAARFNGRTVFLIRHPIPVALSRKSTPKLATILSTDFRRYFSPAQLEIAQSTIEGGGQFEKSVLDWCLRNSVALKARKDEWVVLSYEQLVVHPEPAVEVMAERLDLPEPERMLRRLEVPSRSTGLSNPETVKVLQDNRDVNGKQWLVEKWMNKVSREKLAVAADLVEAFGLHQVYSMNEALPSSTYWV